jgi:putative ubiquitin-RnfH superfamily antitoxin RatB of RatAB toxin-antitoxin module
MENSIQIEVVYATPTIQNIVNLEVNSSCTIRQAILNSGLASEVIDNMVVGIFGKRRSLDYGLQNGDRVEIYTPLLIDPKIARKDRAKRSKQAKRRKN